MTNYVRRILLTGLDVQLGVAPVSALGIPATKKKEREKKMSHCAVERWPICLPDLGVRLETEPVGQRTVLLLSLAKLDLGDE
jgi:hypothetical protein